MGHTIGDHVYGESGIEFLLVDRSLSRHRVRSFHVDVRLGMDHPEVYRDGDNTRLVPVSSIANAVLALGARHTGADPETFALALAEHFFTSDHPPRTADVLVSCTDLAPLPAGAPQSGVRHFGPGARPRDHAHVTLPYDGEPSVHGGLRGVELFVTGGATFTGFARDAYTTTRAATDRVFGARLDVTWHHTDKDADFHACRLRAGRAVTEAFAGHTSRSSQHTFYQVGTAVLDACPEIAHVRVEGAHLTRAPVDLTAFGIDNDGRVYTASDNQQSTVSVDVHRT
uniref:factor independent urate hydroxylase n=1 Tax=Streptomyces sp. MA37 TaxID=1400207 RepID=A0A0U1XV55_9ACTN|nr:putative urate oxidase [Streptomyces sp. MA37]